MGSCGGVESEDGTEAGKAVRRVLGKGAREVRLLKMWESGKGAILVGVVEALLTETVRLRQHSLVQVLPAQVPPVLGGIPVQ